jgi:hypothetical protein
LEKRSKESLSTTPGHVDDNVAVSLDQSEHRGLFRRKCSAAASSSQTPPPSFAIQVTHNIWTPFVPGDDVHFVSFDLAT